MTAPKAFERTMFVAFGIDRFMNHDHRHAAFGARRTLTGHIRSMEIVELPGEITPRITSIDAI
jgi:hypothetical protein